MQNFKKALLDKIFNKTVFAATMLIWSILNICEVQKLYFVETNTAKVFPMKLLHILFLYSIIFAIFAMYKSKDTKKGKYRIIVTLATFAGFFLLLILTWPGTWSWDDVFIVQKASQYDTSAWQHFFSGIFHILCLQTIPFVSGVIIMQILIIALIFGYCVSEISFAFAKEEKHIKIFVIGVSLLAFFPPIVAYALCGFRMGPYSFTELLLITKMLLMLKKGLKPSLCDLFGIAALTIIVASWRTEALYYPILIFIIFLLFSKKIDLKKSVAFIMLAATLVGTFAVGRCNNALIGNSNYSISATIQPVASIIHLQDERDAEEMEIINEVIDVEYIKANPKITGEAFLWTEGVIKDYTDDEYSAYTKALVKLYLRHPQVVLSFFWSNFYNAVGFGRNGMQTTRNTYFSKGELAYDPLDTTNSVLKDPINEDLRQTFLKLINGTDSEKNTNVIHVLFWNLFIPLTLMLISLAFKLAKKNWATALIISTVLARVPLLFVTSPAPYFMYYLSVYLISYFLSFIVIYEMVCEFAKKYKTKKESICDNVITE